MTEFAMKLLVICCNNICNNVILCCYYYYSCFLCVTGLKAGYESVTMGSYGGIGEVSSFRCVVDLRIEWR